MTKRILKYLILKPDVTVDLPKDAEILSIAEQKRTIVLYASSEINETMEERHAVKIVATGEHVELAGWRFRGTINLDDGDLMYHAFTRKL